MEVYVLAIDFYGLIKRNWIDTDVQVCICDICGKKGLCTVLKRNRKRLAICENCFIDNSGRFVALEDLNNTVLKDRT
jgi:hypothetical protein